MDADDVLDEDDDDEGPRYFVSEVVRVEPVSFARAEIGARAMRECLLRLTGHEPLGARVVPKAGRPVVRTEIGVADAEQFAELIERFMDLVDIEFGKYPYLVPGDEPWRLLRLPDDIDYGQAHPAWYAVGEGVDGASFVAGYARALPVAARLSAALVRILLRPKVIVDPVVGQEGELGAAVRFDLEPNECERVVGEMAALLVSGFAHRKSVDKDGIRP